MAGILMPARFRLVASFGFGREENASKPLQVICKTLSTIKYMDIQHLKNITQVFLQDYERAQRDKLSNEPVWKIDSIIREVIKSQNSEIKKLELNEKIDWLIENDRNPFIKYAKELLADLTTNDKINSLISAMTNGKFLDSIGIYSNQTPVSEMISDYVDKISVIKI
tara:strand:- start:109 stop:609 length:501 start_codon:yes stop_codon:yes gene_type:complete